MTFSHSYILRGYTNLKGSSSIRLSNYKEYKILGSISENKSKTIEASACIDCITLPLCRNKLHTDLIFCPLLDPLFREILTDLSSLDTSGYSTIIRLVPLNITVWFIRHHNYGKIGIIRNGDVESVFREFEL